MSRVAPGLRFVTTVGGSRAACGELLVMGSPRRRPRWHSQNSISCSFCSLDCARANGTTPGGFGSDGGTRKGVGTNFGSALASCKTLANIFLVAKTAQNAC